MKLKFATPFLIALLFASVSCGQQDKSQRPSPPAKASCSLSDGSTISIDYGSPRAKGRKIFGGIVPYGQEWRLGANEATTFVISSDVMVGKTKVPAGSYTLFALPTAQDWSLIISKKTGEWGVPYPGKDSDFARVGMNVGKTSAPVENFTIALDKTGNGCKLRAEWENTSASVDITK
jgi:Protein of unknown function (DUF2911)